MVHMNQTLVPPAPTVPRDRWGRPLVIPAAGGKPIPYRRCTTFIDVLEDRWALELWKQRNVAAGMAARPDLVLKAASAAGDKNTLNEVCKEAADYAGQSTAATTGTALHAITEQLDRGMDVTIPPSSQPDIDAYRQATAELVMQELEVFVVDDDLQVGGTFDRIVSWGGRRYVADIKTGRVDYAHAKIAMQLAVYAGSARYRPDTGGREDLAVSRDWGLVIHLPAGAGECAIWWVNLADGRAGVDVASRVWQWRTSRHEFARQFTPVGELIAAAGSVEHLETIWRQHAEHWRAEWTQAAAGRKKQLLAQGAPAGEREGIQE